MGQSCCAAHSGAEMYLAAVGLDGTTLTVRVCCLVGMSSGGDRSWGTIAARSAGATGSDI